MTKGGNETAREIAARPARYVSAAHTNGVGLIVSTPAYRMLVSGVDATRERGSAICILLPAMSASPDGAWPILSAGMGFAALITRIVAR